MSTDHQSDQDPTQAPTAPEVGLPEPVRNLLMFESLKTTVRQNPIACGDRQELVGEHCWHLALAVPLLAQYCPDEIDVSKATLLAVVHDLAEVFVGDTFAFGSNTGTQHDREQAAMQRLRDSTSDIATKSVIDLWEEYEAQATPEARFVKGLDAFVPILLNYTNLSMSSWQNHEVPAAKVQARLDRVRSSIGELADLNDQMIKNAREAGVLQ